MSMPALNVGRCCAEGRTAAPKTSALVATTVRAWRLATRIPRMITPSKDFVPGDSHDVRPHVTVRVHATKAEAPLDGNERAERRRRLDSGAKSRVVANAASESWIVDPGRIDKPIHADRAAGRPGDSAPKHGAAVVAHERRRIAVEPVVERSERKPAEPIEVLAGHHGALDARREPRRERDRSQQRRAGTVARSPRAHEIP